MTKKEILRIFSQFSSGDISLENFEEWVVSHLQLALDSGDRVAIRLLDEADGLLMRLGDGEISEADVFRSIESRVREAHTITLSMSILPDVMVTFHDPQVDRHLTELPEPVDRRRFVSG